MRKKIISGIAIFIVASTFFVYLDPLDFNISLYEIKWAARNENFDPISTVQRVIEPLSEAHVLDPDFKVEKVAKGLEIPVNMAFIGDDILVLEKTTGKVKLVRNDVLQETPVLDVEVISTGERGLLGIAVADSTVYLYFTKSVQDGGDSLGNYIYKYNWDGESLRDPELVNVLPGHSLWHNGGDMTSDLDGNIYAVIGDQTPINSPIENYRLLQNVPSGDIDDTSLILRVGLNSSEPRPKLAPNTLDHYYAIGIRNSFGITIDPVTGNLWDTENGLESFDEINLVAPKFNSGWIATMGPATDDQLSNLTSLEGFVYSDPEFSWEKTVSPTGLIFANSEQFKKYKNDLFVGDCNMGNLYRFTLNEERTGFIFDDPNLADLVVNKNPEGADTLRGNFANLESMDEILFGKNFGCIGDVTMGPDGLLYVVSVTSGSIYRISPS